MLVVARKMVQKYKRKIVHFGEDFDIEIEKFLQIIQKDKEMIDSIPDNQKKKVLKVGMFSHAIKELIKSYNEANWKGLIKKKKHGNSSNNPKV